MIPQCPELSDRPPILIGDADELMARVAKLTDWKPVRPSLPATSAGTLEGAKG
jgi:hypothetical protein